MSLTTTLRDQVRSLLAQGYRIGAEHADQRRFKTSSWLSCGAITGQREEQVLHEIESFLKDYSGEYVRLIGIDPQAKRRVLESIIQRPGETPTSTTASAGNGHYRPAGTPHASPGGSNGQVNSNVRTHLRSLLDQGYKIGTEYANQRRFKTSSWQTGPTIEGYQENAVIRSLEAVIAEHPDEYVRVVGIDTKAKRRVLELIVQRPGERANLDSNGSTTSTSYHSSHRGGTPIKTGIASDLISQVRSLLAQGYKIGTEHADKRRFKTSSWQSCTPIESHREPEVIAALEACIAEHQGEYVRLLGIDSKAKRRVLEAIIHRPDEKAQNAYRPANESVSTSSYSSPSKATTAYGHNRLDAEVVSQVRALIAQGHKIGMEHADKRRFRTNSWQSCTPVESSREADVLAALENCIAEHQGEYVRLLGIDTKAKRRVLESIIQRP